MSPSSVNEPARPARDHPQLHRRQVLRLVHDHVPVAGRRLDEHRASLVEQRQVGLAPAAARAAQEPLLVLVEHAVGGRGERLARGRAAARTTCSGFGAGQARVEEARQPPVLAQRALDLVEGRGTPGRRAARRSPRRSAAARSSGTARARRRSGRARRAPRRAARRPRPPRRRRSGPRAARPAPAARRPRRARPPAARPRPTRGSAFSRCTSGGSARVSSTPGTSSATARWSTLSSPSVGRTCETYSMKAGFGPTTSTRRSRSRWA